MSGSVAGAELASGISYDVLLKGPKGGGATSVADMDAILEEIERLVVKEEPELVGHLVKSIPNPQVVSRLRSALL